MRSASQGSFPALFLLGPSEVPGYCWQVIIFALLPETSLTVSFPRAAIGLKTRKTRTWFLESAAKAAQCLLL